MTSPNMPPMRTLALAIFAASSCAMAAAPGTQPGASDLEFFEKKIRPVLVDKCYKCHSESADKIKGGLVLDTREGIRRGGDSGPAVVPGDVKESILSQALSYTNKDFAMPPEKEGGKLPDAVIKDFETWIKMGAPDPRDGAAKIVQKVDLQAARDWWSYQPVQKPPIPQPRNAAWAYNDTDKFILAAIEGKGLKPVGDADALTLLRRISFAITGLPPSPEEIAKFFKEWPPANHPDARNAQQAVLAKWIDRLLA